MFYHIWEMAPNIAPNINWGRDQKGTLIPSDLCQTPTELINEFWQGYGFYDHYLYSIGPDQGRYFNIIPQIIADYRQKNAPWHETDEFQAEIRALETMAYHVILP